MDMKILIAAGIITIALIVLIKWGAGARYGKIQPNKEVTEAYDCFSVDPNMIYYISGSDVYPNAIIGIDKAWTLESDLWKKKELNAQGMKELVQNMQSKTMDLCLTLHGFVILDNHERKIGNWFSVMGINTVVEIIGERRVVIHTPPLDTYRHS